MEISENLLEICEFPPAEMLFKKQHFDTKGTQHFKRFVRMKQKKVMKIKFKVKISLYEGSIRTIKYSII